MIYVGKARNLRKRVSTYFTRAAQDNKTTKLVSELKFIDHVIVESEIEAFLLEANLIKKYRPIYNVRYTDDKIFPYLEVKIKEEPYVVLTRKLENQDALYLGPYTNVTDLKIVLRLLRRIFPYQSVKNHPKRRCLYNHMGLCPCVPVHPEKLSESRRNLRNLVSFLKGNKNKVIHSLKKEQKECIKRQEFEKAGDIQRKIEKIGLITSDTYDPFKYVRKPDYYFNQIRSEVFALRKILNRYGISIENLDRIECYDVSNISGKSATGSMVVFTDGDSNKNEYRKFRIMCKRTPDDFEMMREVIRRRIRRSEWQKPNLMVIDGGRGQVSAALQVLAEQSTEIPVIGLAKKEETIIIPVNTSTPGVSAQSTPGVDFIEVNLPKSTPGVNLLRRLRDEAHRFALAYHRLLRKKILMG